MPNALWDIIIMASYRAMQTPMVIKLAMLCDHIESLNLTPKVFITTFLNHLAKNISFRCCFWATKAGCT
ncbi:hypothetical protein VP01_1946g9 [Puccinia sorghi]|uniref:Uncharacterized protein n=1 Tax=Puccinia sorghi TaxID=27349 RepID=A0A0L6VE36_9BASI|nr:hypothetical protein VP01_1946g9 [Puccinia sorghi]